MEIEKGRAGGSAIRIVSVRHMKSVFFTIIKNF